MSTWKAVERKVAEIIGGERIPVSGRQRGDNADIKHPVYSIEVKHRKSLPEWMHDAMRQAEASNKGGQLPIVIYHENGQQYKDSFVMVRLQDFVDWYGEVEQQGEEMKA